MVYSRQSQVNFLWGSLKNERRPTWKNPCGPFSLSGFRDFRHFSVAAVAAIVEGKTILSERHLAAGDVFLKGLFIHREVLAGHDGMLIPYHIAQGGVHTLGTYGE